jgi:phage shock protein E
MKKTSESPGDNKVTIIDVRSPVEFCSGHVKGSINIPLQEIPARIAELKDMKHIIFCCASGNRSRQAVLYTQQHGIKSEDAGSWLNITL